MQNKPFFLCCCCKYTDTVYHEHKKKNFRHNKKYMIAFYLKLLDSDYYKIFKMSKLESYFLESDNKYLYFCLKTAKNEEPRLNHMI